MPAPVLDTILTANRARYNTKFAEARHYKPTLEGEAFADLLRNLVAPVVESVHQVRPEATEAVTEALYDTVLDLLAQDFLGPTTRYPAITSGWTHVLPKLGKFLAANPRAVIGAVTNGLYNIAATPGARPGEWLRDLIALDEVCDDVDALLKAGQVCAWRAGLAHYRTDALTLAAELPQPVARLALGLPADDAQPFESILARLHSSPWESPIASLQSPHLKIVKRVGAFRGFGGLFMVPPIVEPAGEHFLVTDGESTWLLTADVFGATFHRMAKPTPSAKVESPFKLNRNGEVSFNRQKQTFSELAQATSSAGNTHTLAVTVPYSHSIYLVSS